MPPVREQRHGCAADPEGALEKGRARFDSEWSLSLRLHSVSTLRQPSNAAWPHMQALEIRCNGRPVVTAGAADALLVSLHLTALVDGEHPATLRIGGMRDLGNERQSHARWIEEMVLAEGDELHLTLVSVDEATSPAEDVAADSEQHLAEQAEYEKELAANPPRPTKLERRRPIASLQLSVGAEPALVASFGDDGELLSLGATWNSWHPERFHLNLSSCSCEQAIARKGGRDWFNGHVSQGETVLVRICG